MASTNTPSKPPSKLKDQTTSKPSPSSTAPAPAASEDPTKTLEKLEIKTKAINANNIARVANSHLTSSDAKLQPLVSLKTGKPLEKFPATSGEIEKMSLINVDAILNALEADRSGSEGVKKERLRVQVGLKANPA